MDLRSGVAACAVSVLAMVFSVQQGEHGPLVVYKLQVPGTAATLPAVPEPPGAGAPMPRLRSGITRVPEHPATKTLATRGPAPAPRSLETVVMPASALPPPRITPVATAPVAIPYEAPRPPSRRLPTLSEVVAVEPTLASLQPRVLGTVAVSEIEALTGYEPLASVPDREVPGDYVSGSYIPSSREVSHLAERSEVGTAMINEETGESLTLQDVNDAVVWRRDTAERLRQVPIAPRF